jgi:DNA replication protein DnaC
MVKNNNNQKIPSLAVMSGVQTDHAHSDLNNFEDRYAAHKSPKLHGQIIQLAKDLAAGTLDYRYVFLLGASGHGKTHALVGLYRARAYADNGIVGAGYSFYTQFTSLITDIIGGFSDSIALRPAMAKYFAVKYMFIDDVTKLGAKLLKEEKIENQVFREIMHERWESKRTLFCTANFNTKEKLISAINGAFGEYTLSRIKAGSLFLEFPGTDWRAAGHNE